MRTFLPLAFWAACLFSVTDVVGEPAVSKKTYVCYRSFNRNPEMTRAFADMGISVRCFFAANTVNGLGGEYCQYPMIWKGEGWGTGGQYDFGALDAQVGDLLKASPSAKLLCMVDLNTPLWMTRRYGMDSFDVISHFACSEDWKKRTMVWIGDFLAYAEKKHGHHIVGYILSGGGTSEWYEENKGNKTSDMQRDGWKSWCAARGFPYGETLPTSDELKKASFGNAVYDPATEGKKIAWWRFHNGVIADTILDYAAFVRPLVPREKEIGVFFGYYLSSAWAKLTSFGHLDYERVFASPDIDFVIAPGTYADRAIGAGSGSQLILGTARRYGKRFLHEIDHRTHTVYDKGDDAWKTTAEDIAGLRREAAYSLVNHGSRWWFDMWKDHYKEEKTRAAIAQFERAAAPYANDEAPSAAQVLYVADPQSAYFLNETSPVANQQLDVLRKRLNRLGLPYDTCSFGDLDVLDLSGYKVILFPGTVFVDAERKALLRKKVMTDGRTLLWFYAPGLTDGKTLDAGRVEKLIGVPFGAAGVREHRAATHVDVYVRNLDMLGETGLSDVLRKAGVFRWIADDVPVYANQKLFAIHVKKGGVKRIQLPRRAKEVREILSGRLVARDADAFDYAFSSPDTAVFSW